MRISASQIVVFSQVADNDFVARVIAFLRGRFADAREAPRSELDAGVRMQAAKAGTYGLTTERQVASYVTTAWVLGPDFDTQMPYLRGVLRTRTIGPDRKAKLLADHTEQIIATLEGA